MTNLIVDCIPFEYVKAPLKEGANANGKFVVKGILQRAKAKNQNGRVYPLEILKREALKYDEHFVREHRALGELDHPESEVVNLKNASHNIVGLEWDGDNLIGTVEILTTPSGNILKELFSNGIKLGISSRGLGTVKNLAEGTVEVQNDFQIIAWDFVSNPSTFGAFMFPVGSLNEGTLPPKLISEKNKWYSVEKIVRDILSEIK